MQMNILQLFDEIPMYLVVSLCLLVGCVSVVVYTKITHLCFDCNNDWSGNYG